MESNESETKKAFDFLRVASERLISIALGDRIHINKLDRLSDLNIIVCFCMG